MHDSRPGADPVRRDRATRAPRSTVVWFAALLLATTLPVAAAVADYQPVGASRVWSVAPWGDDAAPGTLDAPVRTVRFAVRVAAPGDTIELRGGVYRETVQVYAKALTIRSRDGERAVFDGAVVVDGFRPESDRWVADGWTTQFHRESSGGPVANDHIVAGYPDQVFLDGRPLRQVLSLAEVMPGTFFHETDADRLWLGDDPTGRLVEASKLRWALYFNRAHGSRLENVTVRRYATEARQMGAIRAYADRLTMSGLLVEQNARMGLSAIGRQVVITDSSFLDNGYIGVHGDRLDTFVLEESVVRGNNREGFDPFHSGAGVKVTRSRGVTVRESDVSANGGPGVWTDLGTQFVTIVRTVLADNRRAGIEIELSSDVNVLSNLALDNGEAGIWVLESQNVQVLHNASFGNVNAIEVEEGPRRDVRNVRILNNTMGDPAPGTRAVLDVNDWTAERSARDMGVIADHNAYWLPDGADAPLSRWGRWPEQLAWSGDLDQHRSVTSQGWNSVVVEPDADANPLARAIDVLDYRGRDELQRGAAVTGQAAADLGIESGDIRRIGPVAPIERPGG
ncbi:MAG: right-handed parallel beta-helix repeat-containing protein [Actinomycetota bacterium]